MDHALITFQSAGVRLAGEQWDPGGDRLGTVLLAHGGGQTRHSWRTTGLALSKIGWRTVAYDARGHGDSDWSPRGVYSTDLLAEDMSAVIDALGEPPVIIGASLGGTSAMLVAGEDPETARALVVVDVLPRVERAGSDRIRAFMRSGANGFDSLEEAGQSIQRYNPHRPPPASYEGLRKNLRQREDGRWYWHWDPAFLSMKVEPTGDAAPSRVQQAAGNISVPVLVVRGLQSDVVSDEGVEEFRRLVPGARFAEVPAGHMLVGDDNSDFTTEVVGFLAELASGTATSPTSPPNDR